MNWFGPAGDCGCCGEVGPCQGALCVDPGWHWAVKICNLVPHSQFNLADDDNQAFYDDIDGLLVSFGIPVVGGTGGFSVLQTGLGNPPYNLRINSIPVYCDGIRLGLSYSVLSDCTRNQNATLTLKTARIESSQCPTDWVTRASASLVLGLPDCTISQTVNSGSVDSVQRSFGVCVTAGVGNIFSSSELVIVRGQFGVSDPGC